MISPSAPADFPSTTSADLISADLPVRTLTTYRLPWPLIADARSARYTFWHQRLSDKLVLRLLGEKMPLADHMEGFEKGAHFSQMCIDLRGHNPETRFSAIYQAIAKIAPAYIEAIRERKACLRKLRYIGCTWCPEESPTDDEFFKLGQIYVSTSFNGATYNIDGYGDTPIGYAYFEWLKES